MENPIEENTILSIASTFLKCHTMVFKDRIDNKKKPDLDRYSPS